MLNRFESRLDRFHDEQTTQDSHWDNVNGKYIVANEILKTKPKTRARRLIVK